MMAGSGQEAVENARRFTSYNPPGYCLKFVRAEAWQIGGLYGSAIDAWHGAKRRHPDDRNPPLGAPMFYDSPTSQYGHIVVNTGQNDIRSTDCQTSGDVSETDIDWPTRAWGQGYLGWTEDLNGVDLPLGEEEEMSPEDWEKLRKIVREEVAANNVKAADVVWYRESDVTNRDGEKSTQSAQQTVRQTYERTGKILDAQEGQ